MPEGPELFLSAQFINRICSGILFSGKVCKSEVSWKNPDVAWNYPTYTIRAHSRGKEMKLTLVEVKNAAQSQKIDFDKFKFGDSLDILFRFGMSGRFAFTSTDAMAKHAHLNFYTRDDNMVLSFVDMRRFGRWEIGKSWSDGRGPCVIQEPVEFRQNVIDHLQDSAFNRPICEALLNQKFFNGIGNYLRAEILYRLAIPPFECARDVLAPLLDGNVKVEKPDILDLCNIVPTEVTNLNGSGYDPEASTKDYSAFHNWLQCYYVKDMKNMADHNNRTIWFTGDAGPMVPSAQRTKKAVKRYVKNKTESKGAKKLKSEGSESSEGYGSDEKEVETKVRVKKEKVKNEKVKKEKVKKEKVKKEKVKKEKVKKEKIVKKEEKVKTEPVENIDPNIRRSSRVLARTKQKAKR